MSIITQRREERLARQAEAEQATRQAAQEALLTPTFNPEPTTDLEHAVASAILTGADALHSIVADGRYPQAQLTAARSLYAADAVTFYSTIRLQAGTSQRDLDSFETQVTLTWLKRELDASITRALAQVDAIRQDAAQRQAIRLHAHLKNERAKRDKFRLTITVTEAERAAELGVPRPAPKAIIIPPPGTPGREELMARVMAARAAEEAEATTPRQPAPEAGDGGDGPSSAPDTASWGRPGVRIAGREWE